MNSKRKQSCVEQTARGPLASVLSSGKSSKYLADEKSKMSKKMNKKMSLDETLKHATPELEKSWTYHKMSLSELSVELQTSCTQGLTEQRASELLTTNGPNILKPPETHYIRKALGYMFGGFCWLLWIGVVVCILAWRPIGKKLR